MTLTEADRERVTHPAGPAAPAARHLKGPPFSSFFIPTRRPRGGREGGRKGGRNRTHGADGVKEHLTKARLAGGADGPGRPPPASRSYKIDTTLGNGYLGSRIDEERSEMRYLV